MVQIRVSPILFKIKTSGLNRDLNPGPLAPKARIIPLDHWAIDCDILKNWPSIIRLLQGHTTCQTWPSTAVFKQIFSCCYESLYSSVAERWSCKPKVMSSILIGGNAQFWLDQHSFKKILMTPTWFEHAAFWSGVRRATVAPRSQSYKVLPRFELGSLDSKSRVLTITP